MAPELELSVDSHVVAVVGKPLTIVATGSQENHDALTVSVSGQPAAASFSDVAPTGTLTWTPTAADANKSFKLKFTVTDTVTSLTASEDVSIAVVKKASDNLPPELDSISSPYNGHAGEKLSFTVTASDPNDDKLSFSASNLPAGAQLVQQGFDAATQKWAATYSWTPTDNQAQKAFNVKFTVKDHNTHSAQASASTTLNVLPSVATQNDPIQAVVIAQARGNANTDKLVVSGTVKVKKHASSVSGHTVTISDADTSAVIGTTQVGQNGRWTYTGTVSPLPKNVKVDIDGHSALRPVKATH